MAVRIVPLLVVWLFLSSPLGAQDTAGIHARGDSVSVRFVDADLRAVVHALSRYLPKPVMVGNVPSVRVSLETPAPVSRATLATLLKGLIASQNLEFSEDSDFIRIGPKPPSPPERPAAGVPPSGGSLGAVELFVIRLKHARAADVAATVGLLFGTGGELAGRPGLSTGTLSDELRRNLVSAPAPATPASGGTATSPAILRGPVTIVPDHMTNAVLVRGSKEDYRILLQAIEQLDVRPLQVLIEVLIVEARRDRHFSLGADIFVPKQNIGGDQTIEGKLRGGGLGDVVVEIMNLGRPDIDAVLRLAQSKGDVKIISRPVLLASNNTEARLLVGSQRPFIQVSRSLPTDAPTRDQVVQYRDVGTKLIVRPTINQDGYVSLLIQQEINAATGEVQFDAPVLSTREASTQVLVRDGQTIVLGGMQDQQRERTRAGVPLLSGLPIIGGVFGSSNRRDNTTELYLFLTPRILRTDDDIKQVTAPRLERGGFREPDAR
jgi:general secretion pathway protein D